MSAEREYQVSITFELSAEGPKEAAQWVANILTDGFDGRGAYKVTPFDDQGSALLDETTTIYLEEGDL